MKTKRDLVILLPIASLFILTLCAAAFAFGVMFERGNCEPQKISVAAPSQIK